MRNLNERKGIIINIMKYTLLFCAIIFVFSVPLPLKSAIYRVSAEYYFQFREVSALFVNNNGDILAGNNDGIYYYSQAKAEWSKSFSCRGINSFFYSNDKKHLFAYNDTALYKSTDDGKSWLDVLFNNNPIRDIKDYAFNPKTNEIFLSFVGDIYKSPDYGDNWTVLDKIPTTDTMAAKYSFYWLEFDSNGKLFAVLNKNYEAIRLKNLLTSTDGGVTWKDYMIHLPTDTLYPIGVSQFKIISDSLQIINTSFALSVSHDGFKLTDVIVKNNYLSVSGNLAYYDPIKKEIFVNRLGSDGINRLYKSTDNGITFDSIYTFQDIQSYQVPFVVDKSGNIFIKSSSITKFDSTFSNSKLIADQWQNSRVSSADTTDSRRLVFGTDKGEIIEMLDPNYTNQKVHIIDSTKNLQINSISHGLNNTWLIICDSSRLYKTSGKFDKFINITDGIGEYRIFTLLLNKNHILYISTSNGIYYSDDTAKSWKQFLPLPEGRTINDFLIDDSNTLYAGTDSNGIFISSITTPKWKKINNGLEALSVTQIVKNSKNDIFATIKGYGVYKLDRSSNAWVEKNSEIKKYIPLNIDKIFIDAFDNLQIFFSSSRFYCSTDNANSWEEIKNIYNDYEFHPPVQAFQFDSCDVFIPIYGGTIYRLWIDSNYTIDNYWKDSVNIRRNLIFVAAKYNSDIYSYNRIIYHKDQNQFSTIGPQNLDIRTWDLKSGDVVRTLQMQDANFITYSDDSLIYWYGHDKAYNSTNFYLKGYNYKTRSYIEDTKLNGFTNEYSSVFSDANYDYIRKIFLIKRGKISYSGPNALLSISFDQLSSGFEKRISIGNTYTVNNLATPSRFDYLYSQKYAEYLFKNDNSFKKIDTNGNLLQLFDKPDSLTNNIQMAVLSNDNRYVAGFIGDKYGINRDSVLVIWDYKTGAVLHKSVVNLRYDDYYVQNSAYLMKFTEDGKYIIVTNPNEYYSNTRVFFIDIQTGNVVKQIIFPDFAITSFTFTEGYRIIAGCSDGYLRLVDLGTLLDVSGENNISTNTELEIQMQPNPVTDNALLRINSSRADQYSIIIYDMFGREAYKIENYMINTRISYINLNLNGFAKGCYFIKAVSSSGIKTLKFMKD